MFQIGERTCRPEILERGKDILQNGPPRSDERGGHVAAEYPAEKITGRDK